MEPIALIVIIVVTAILGIFLTYYLTKLRFEARFRQSQEIERRRWEIEIDKARKSAIIQSRAVLGQISDYSESSRIRWQVCRATSSISPRVQV